MNTQLGRVPGPQVKRGSAATHPRQPDHDLSGGKAHGTGTKAQTTT